MHWLCIITYSYLMPQEAIVSSSGNAHQHDYYSSDSCAVCDGVAALNVQNRLGNLLSEGQKECYEQGR